MQGYRWQQNLISRAVPPWNSHRIKYCSLYLCATSLLLVYAGEPPKLALKDGRRKGPITKSPQPPSARSDIRCGWRITLISSIENIDRAQHFGCDFWNYERIIIPENAMKGKQKGLCGKSFLCFPAHMSVCNDIRCNTELNCMCSGVSFSQYSKIDCIM